MIIWEKGWILNRECVKRNQAGKDLATASCFMIVVLCGYIQSAEGDISKKEEEKIYIFLSLSERRKIGGIKVTRKLGLASGITLWLNRLIKAVVAGMRSRW